MAKAVSAQITDTLIKKHLDVIGGASSCKRLQPYEATYVYESGGDRTELQVYRGQGKLLRVNKKYFYRNQPIHAGKAFFDLVNEQGAWTFAPDETDTLPRVLSAYEVEYLLASYEWDDPFIDYRQRGLRIDYLSTEYFNETFYHKFLVFYKSGKQEYVYMHPETYMIDRRIVNDPSVVDDKAIPAYVKVNGTCWLPKVIQMGDSELRLMQFKSNNALPSGLFASPKKVAKPR